MLVASSIKTALFALAVSALACSSDRDRPPVQAACGAGTGCTPVNSTGNGPQGSAGAAGASANPDAQAGTLAGTVVAYAGDDFTITQPFPQAATVRGYGPAGTRVTAAWTGSGEFLLSGLEPTNENWISVVPGQQVADFLTTYHPVVTEGVGRRDLALVRGSVLDQVFSVLTLPIERVPTRGHAALFFKDASNQPLAGVRVQQAQAETIAYADAAWTDDTLARTSAQGLVLIGNIVADADPGSLRVVNVTGSITGAFEIRVAQNAVTVAEIRLSP